MATNHAINHDGTAPNLTFKQLCIYYEEKILEPTEQFIDSLNLRQSNDEYNYAAYLLADENGASIKVATYAGTDKVDLLETREYGNRCLITATHRILDRMALIIEVSNEWGILAQSKHDISVLSYNEWSGAYTYPEFLAAFVTPNHPYVSEIPLKSVSHFMEMLRPDFSFYLEEK